jgi:hypothetical protein
MMRAMAKEDEWEDKPRCGEPVPDGVFADGVNATCNRLAGHDEDIHNAQRRVNGVYVRVTWSAKGRDDGTQLGGCDV